MEEVGVKVRNIRYFGSQPWPFPDSLMMAFIAEYESGEIKVDNLEISKAAWFRADRLPNIPGSESIAGKIIRWYQDTCACTV
jgi:NAD+ diphosphatase